MKKDNSRSAFPLDSPQAGGMPSTPATSHRLAFIDALRGVAVLLMITQHVSLWFCGHCNKSLFLLLTGGLGGFSAPLFVTLAGVGVSLLCEQKDRADQLLVSRGGIIVGFGYVMNLLTPHWFSAGSWYVLHMIGMALMAAPLLRRLSDNGLMVMIFAVLAITGLLQYSLETPFRMFNRHMAASVGLGGIVRYALVEGYFPIFPWLAFFIGGLLAGRWLMVNRLDHIRRLATLLLVVMTALLITDQIWPDVTRSEALVRYFKLQLSFYSALTPLSLFLIAVSLFLVIGFNRLDQKRTFASSHALVCLGRVSLTFLIVHVSAIRESAFYFGYWRSLSHGASILATIAVLVFFALAAKLWQRYHYVYGFEWLLRRLSVRPWRGRVNSNVATLR